MLELNVENQNFVRNAVGGSGKLEWFSEHGDFWLKPNRQRTISSHQNRKRCLQSQFCLCSSVEETKVKIKFGIKMRSSFAPRSLF